MTMVGSSPLILLNDLIDSANTSLPAEQQMSHFGLFSVTPIGLALIELVPPGVPPSAPAFPFSPNCFPDLYAPSIFPWWITGPGWNSFPMPAIPPLYTGKVLFQNVGIGGTFELSTPTVVDVQ